MTTRKSKNANSEGSIGKRSDGRWQARITLENGQHKYYYAKTRTEAARLLATALHDRNCGLPIVSEKQTVGQYLAEWLQRTKPTVKPKTYRSYEQLTRVHLIPALGRVSLAKLGPRHVQTLWSKKLEAGKSPTTVRLLHMVLHKALADALRLGLVQRNVTDLVDPPRAAHYEMQVLTPEQVYVLLAAAEGSRLQALYVLALATGMREGELLALRWRDVDLEAASLQVRHTLQKLPREQFVFAEPKTRRSRRKIVLPVAAVTALRRHRARQLEERLQHGALWEDLDVVFAHSLGRPLDSSSLLHYDFHPLLKRAGLPKIRFHDLRHTAATLLLGKGINPKIVSELLGHASVAITLDLYSHVLPCSAVLGWPTRSIASSMLQT
jgi:integrase